MRNNTLVITTIGKKLARSMQWLICVHAAKARISVSTNNDVTHDIRIIQKGRQQKVQISCKAEMSIRYRPADIPPQEVFISIENDPHNRGALVILCHTSQHTRCHEPRWIPNGINAHAFMPKKRGKKLHRKSRSRILTTHTTSE